MTRAKQGSAPRTAEFEPSFSLVLKDASGATIDHIDALLLHNIAERRSISAAAKVSGISYRGAWDRIRAIQTKLGREIVLAQAGGASGGGASLTAEGTALISEYRKLNTYLFGALGDKDFWQHISYRLSARNRIRAKVLEVREGPITSEVKMEIRGPGRLTSIISNEAVEDLDLKPGDEVEAIVKATEVVLAKTERPLHL
ncbi:MAG: TOBE domain-containing protein [Nitrososphaerota archaeon]|nr:TOBE domain-containing protein [Nitrososphaerota archaeon]